MQNTEIKLEFKQILEILKSKCFSVLGQKHVDRIKIFKKKQDIEAQLNQIVEFKYILEEGLNFPSQNYIEITKILNILKVPNSIISVENTFDLFHFLSTVENIYNFFTKEHREKFFNLFFIIGDIQYEKPLKKEIFLILDEEGKIRNNASKELFEIRRILKQKQNNIDSKFDIELKKAQKSGYLSSELESVRGGIRVLSVLVEHKRKLNGILHGESSTGKTVFIEPQIVVNYRNELFRLYQEEKKEILKILLKLSDFLRPFIKLLFDYQTIIGSFDFVQAKARLASEMSANKPQISQTPYIKLVKSFHPLLFLKNKKNKKTTIPLDIELTDRNKIIVISGPNAGGKSVCLKNIGLNQILMQTGMLIAADSASKLGIFHSVFIDIGDNQSIENDLSTYSYKLKNMKLFSERSDKHTLFLIDEFGTGTEPKAGGAIAESILEILRQKGAFGVVTTHYPNIKIYATRQKGVLNAAMQFDIENLKPSFVLKVGKPGSSFSFEIAHKIGLNPKIIEYAKSKIDTNFQKFDQLIVNLEKEKNKIEKEKEDLEKEKKRYKNLNEKYDTLKKDFEENKNRILAKIKEDSILQIKELNRKFENQIREWKERNRKSTDKSFKPIKEAMEQKKQILLAELSNLQATTKKKQEHLKIGDFVKIKDTNQSGKIEKMNKNRAVISFEDMKIEISTDRLIKTQKKEVLKHIFSSNIDSLKQSADFKPILDIRGNTQEEITEKIMQFLATAVLCNHHEIRIIHGHGKGLLRSKVRKILSQNEFVKSFDAEEMKFGGEAITVVQLK